MRHSLIAAILVVAVLPFPSAVAAPHAVRSSDVPRVVDHHESVLQTSTGTRAALLTRESAGPDTFDLYGGARRVVRDPDGIPGNGDEYVEGKFEDPLGFLPRGLGPGPGNWTGVDRTEVPTYWSVSTFNAGNLGSHGAGNRAMWSGLAADDPAAAGWATAPGYGNDWNDILFFESGVLPDQSVGQTVGLDFLFNLDTEPAYDYFYVEYDSAGIWTPVLTIDGTNKDALTGVFPVPGLRFSDLQARPIVYTGNDYGASGGIRIRLRFESDGAFADEDGLFDSEGAVQIDDVTVTTSLGQLTEDFEGTGPYVFAPASSPLAGDWSSVFPRLLEIDRCAENTTPQVGFVDFGQTPPNAPGVTGTLSTGGSLSSTWDYGIPGGWVVNYTGGLDGVPLDNEVWSPQIEWDLPGPADDGFEIHGAQLQYTIWRHNPLANAFFYVWYVRSYADGSWGSWVSRNFVYFSASAEYMPQTHDVTDLIKESPERVQIALGVVDLAAEFGFPGNDATPAPFFDDVRFRKYRIAGPALATRTIDIANDGFPVGGSIDASTQAARDALDVRFDMARDISSGDLNVSGDSVIVDVAAVLPGTSITSVRMKWALRQNPLFEAAIRSQPSRSVDSGFSSSVDGSGRTIWTGTVAADSSRTSQGTLVEGRWFADLPDEDFLYPGDLLHYSFEAEDSDGRVTTLPNDTTGFGVWDDAGGSTYSRAWTVRALPTIENASGDQPRILVVNDFGRRGAENETYFAFAQLGLLEGRDYDTYTVQGPSSLVSNGIGSAGVVNALGDRRGHGATADQLAGYDTILYLSGNLNTGLLSDGSNEGQNDKSPDIQVMTTWKNLPGPRNTAYFGDFVASAPVFDSPVDGVTYVTTVMGVDVISSDVRNAIGGQTAPIVRPTQTVSGFDTSFIAFGGCFGINQFDDLRPAGTAVRSHGFVDPGTGQLVPGVAAGIVYDRLVNLDRKIDITFPFGFQYVYDDIRRATAGASTRTVLLEEILCSFDGGCFPVVGATDTPSVREPSLGVHPNPFNPMTVVTFGLPREGVAARVEVYDVRGERVRVLHDGIAASADLRLEWNGTDDRGARVASGVYLVKAVTDGFAATKKAVLVK